MDIDWRVGAMTVMAMDVTCGEFAGWRQLRDVRFNEHVGPFFHRFSDEGAVQCAFRTQERNLNSDSIVHGGALLTFADYCLYVAASNHAQCSVVTVSLHGEFLGSVSDGALVKASGEIVSAGRSLIFARGLCTVGDQNIMSFSGVLKRLSRPSVAYVDQPVSMPVERL